MNVRKSVDYSTMFPALDALMAAELPQMSFTKKSASLSAPGQKKAPPPLPRNT